MESPAKIGVRERSLRNLEGLKHVRKELMKTGMCASYCLQQKKFGEVEGYLKELITLAEKPLEKEIVTVAEIRKELIDKENYIVTLERKV
jgi:hypothetical protein